MDKSKKNQIVQLIRAGEDKNNNPVFAIFLTKWDSFDAPGYPHRDGYTDVVFFDSYDPFVFSGIKTELVHLLTKDEAAKAVNDWVKKEIQLFTDGIQGQAHKMLEDDAAARR